MSISPLCVQVLNEDIRVCCLWSPASNNGSVSEYEKKVYDEGKYMVENCKVIEIITLSNQDYKVFTENVLVDVDWLKGKGGFESDYVIEKRSFFQITKEELKRFRDNTYNLAVLIRSKGCKDILINPLRLNYRHVGFPIVQLAI